MLRGYSSLKLPRHHVKVIRSFNSSNLLLAGHSKWANIKHKKGREDANRQNTFSKLSTLIRSAMKEGSDPQINHHLALCLQKAKAANMPKEKIERAMQSGHTLGEHIEHFVLEGFHAGAAILVECLSDKKTRVVPKVRHCLGGLAKNGSVSHLFDRVGEVSFVYPSAKLDSLMDELLHYVDDVNVDEVNEEGNVTVTAVCAPSQLQHIVRLLKHAVPPCEPDHVDLAFHTQNYIQLSAEDRSSLDEVVHELENLDDVQHVYHNAE